MRIAAGVEYCGTNFYGWQKQTRSRTVQQCIEKAFSKVANHAITVQCAGRTDSGVHAFNQVIHFDTTSIRENHSWIFGANSNLPEDVNVTWVKHVNDDFHARFSAISRQYKYIILNRAARSSVLGNLTSWQVEHLDDVLMSESAKYLIGKHDFTSFRATACQSKSPIRVIEYLSVKRHDELIIIDVLANAFLHHMVRNIAGVLIHVGNKKYPATWVKEVLQACDRKRGGITAPASGLYLIKVNYPDEFNIPSSPNCISNEFIFTDFI